MVVSILKGSHGNMNGIILGKLLHESNYTACLISGSKVMTDKDGEPIKWKGFTPMAVASRIRSFRKEGYEVKIEKGDWKSPFNAHLK